MDPGALEVVNLVKKSFNNDNNKKEKKKEKEKPYIDNVILPVLLYISVCSINKLFVHQISHL